ncbi:hypothetical protein [Dokdonia sp.]|uniref:hypothetical protein n=1 Tax=Dokdonia sp. TaxID=2024995 RepID=UPI003264960C
MKYLVLIWIGIFSCIYPLDNTTIVASKGKQYRYFPKELTKKGIYLGMSLEKLTRKRKEATRSNTPSAFKIEVSELATTSGISSYTYLFTKTEQPLLYQIIITYTTMEGVHDRAVTLLGNPNHQGEWRVNATTIKEDFTMGIWTFGQKWVFSGTLEGSEWEKGFSN